MKDFPAVVVLTKKDEGLKEIVYKGELDYENLEKFLSKYAQVKKSELKNMEKRLKETAGKTAKREIAVQNLMSESFEQNVYGTEGLVLIHFFRGNETHKTFSDLVNKYK